jgi:hypothetical protein
MSLVYGCTGEAVACYGKCDRALAYAAGINAVCSTVWGTDCPRSMVALRDGLVGTVLVREADEDWNLSVLLTSGLYPYASEVELQENLIDGWGKDSAGAVGMGDSWRTDGESKLRKGVPGPVFRSAKLLPPERLEPRPDRVVYVVSDQECSGMYEWVEGETVRETGGRACGLPAGQHPFGWQGWVAREGVDPQTGRFHRYHATFTPPIAWPLAMVTMPGDLIVLYREGFCPAQDVCQLMAGEILQPGPSRGPMVPHQPEEPLPPYPSTVTLLGTTWAGAQKWDLQSNPPNTYSTATVARLGFFPSKPGVHVVLFDKTQEWDSDRRRRQ